MDMIFILNRHSVKQIVTKHINTLTTINVYNYYLLMGKMTNERFVSLAKILSDETRLLILNMLAREGSLCACKILAQLRITQGTLSHHMKVLAKHKIVSCRKDGKWRHYCLIPSTLCEMASFIRQICSSPTACALSPCKCDNNNNDE